MRTEWCPDCGDVYDSAASHFCAPHVPTETEDQAKPLPCRTCRHSSVFLGVVACDEGTTATEVDGLSFADGDPSVEVYMWFLGPQDGPCPGYVQRDESTDKKDGGAQ